MRNRAQCNVCKDVIESFQEFDYVSCKCDEIAITGGTIKYECFAKNWENFLRVDDNGHVVPIRVTDKEEDIEKFINEPSPVSKEELIEEMARLIKYSENMSDQALSQPVSQYELLQFLSLIVTILKSH